MALSNALKCLINDMAQAVRDFYGIKTPITNIDDIVNKMGGKIIEDSSLSLSDGKIRKTGAKSFEIHLSPFQSPERKTFTIAHELGHLFLHMGFQTSPQKWDSQDNVYFYRNGNSELEYQANEFAAAFLMPQNQYKEIMAKNTEGNMVNTLEIANFFHVSVEAAANRGKWLGYLKW